MKPALYVVAAVVELSGILLLAAPDLIPGARRFGVWIGPRWRSFRNRLWRRLGIPIRPTNDSGVVTVRLTPSGQEERGFSADAPLEAKVGYLMQRDVESQQAMNRLSKRVETLEEVMPRQLAELRDELTQYATDTVAAAISEYRPVRIAGGLLLTLGLALGTAANLLR